MQICVQYIPVHIQILITVYVLIFRSPYVLHLIHVNMCTIHTKYLSILFLTMSALVYVPIEAKTGSYIPIHIIWNALIVISMYFAFEHIPICTQYIIPKLGLQWSGLGHSTWAFVLGLLELWLLQSLPSLFVLHFFILKRGRFDLQWCYSDLALFCFLLHAGERWWLDSLLSMQQQCHQANVLNYKQTLVEEESTGRPTKEIAE